MDALIIFLMIISGIGSIVMLLWLKWMDLEIEELKREIKDLLRNQNAKV